MKSCRKCGELQALTEFYADRTRGGKDGLKAHCKKCAKKAAKEWSDSQYNYADHRRWVLLRQHYGISRDEYLALQAAQGGLCAICRKKCETYKHLSVDHDHATGEIRGLLCARCNSGIGLLKESPDLLRRAAEFLEKADPQGASHG